MKLIHISDLHLGKRLNEFSLLEDQDCILRQILTVIDDEAPDAVLIAGDVFDKSVPSAEAVALFDEFLYRLSLRRFGDRPLHSFVISGNHDSPERLAFGARLMGASGVHLSPVYNGRVEPTRLWDDHGPVDIYMLPFVKPAHVRRYFPDAEIESYTQALAAAIGAMELDPSARRVLLAHQFVTGAERSDSEELRVGGLDNVDAAVFDGFDYVALGHLHSPQSVGAPRLRYCGTPLKYSFSEASQQKSLSVAELGAKGELSLRTVPLRPLRDMAELRGRYEELMSRSFYEHSGHREDYVHITLTDEDEVPEAMGKLRTVYRNLMKLSFDNARTRHAAELEDLTEAETRSPLRLFSEFYEQQNGVKPDPEQEAFLAGLIREIWEGEE